jgi:release factor glutamine methyltransferase
VRAAAESLADALRAAEQRLAAAGVETPRGDAQWMAAAVLGMSRSDLLAHADEVFPEERRERFEALVIRRERREPLGYILGTINFRGLELEVGPGVFVPRPETETTAERAIVHAGEATRRRPNVVDVGTGCGAIALSVAAEVPQSNVFATEVRGAARGWTLRNLARTGLRVTLLPGDLMEPLHPALGGGVDVIVCNPPYVSETEWSSLPDEVRRFEPRDALIAGPTGLEVVIDLVEQARVWMAPAGWLVFEVAPHQASKVARLLSMVGYGEVRVTPDLAGRDRVVEGRWTGPW